MKNCLLALVLGLLVLPACDDAVFPGAEEIPDDGLDNDCDGGDASCDDDGKSDLLIGAYENDDGGYNAGKAYLLLSLSLIHI